MMVQKEKTVYASNGSTSTDADYQFNDDSVGY